MTAKLTLVIPTKNRPRFLAKVLSYYAARRCPYPLLIGDASDPDQAVDVQALVATWGRSLEIAYETHPPESSTHASTLRLLGRVATPYTVWAGDDDFLVPGHLTKCVRFLEDHADYTIACGAAAWTSVKEMPDGRFTVSAIAPGTHKHLAQDAPSRRLAAWVAPGLGINTYAVHRTDHMRYSWTTAERLGLDSKRCYKGIYEVCFNALSVIQGKQACLPGLYHVMLRHGQKLAFSIAEDYFDLATQWDWPTRVVDTVACWTQELRRREVLTEDQARHIAEAVFLQWILPVLGRNRDRKLTEAGLPVPSQPLRQRLLSMLPWVRKVRHWIRGTPELSLGALLRPSSSYHKDFLPIYRVLTSPTPSLTAEAQLREALAV